MAVEESRLRIRRSLEEKLGVEEASYLMDRPVGGWSDLVTNHTLSLRFAEHESRMDARFAAMEARFLAIDARFAESEAQGDTRFAKSESSMDVGFAKVDARFAELRADIAVVGERVTSLRHELLADMERRFRRQTWAMLTTMIAALGVVAAILAVPKI